MKKRNIGRRLICVMFFTSLLCSAIPVAAQAPKGNQTAANNATAKCSGAWTGNVTYTRTQTMMDTKVTERVSNRGKDTRRWEMIYNYKASVGVLESPERNGSNIGKANIDHKMTSTEKTEAREENSCDRGKTFQVMSGSFEDYSETKGQASNVEANVNVGVNSDGTYSVSVGIPPIQGLVAGKQTATYSGQCKEKEGKTSSLPATPTGIDGHSMTSDGRTRVDPKDPNHLSGSYSREFSGGVETISWSLQKCGAPLRITDIQFEEMKFPNWNDWHEITEQKGTIDGNFVKIKAKVLNESGETKYADVRFKETYKGDKWDGARPDSPLKDDVISVRVGPNSEELVELMWDSSGYAWFDDGRPRLVQRIKAELEENNKKIDEKTENLKIAPKPVVLVHGLWSNWAAAWSSWQNILTTSHSYDWKAFPVGEKPEKGFMNTGKTFMSSEQTASIGDNAHQLESYIKYAQEDRNAWHVDIVAHSMGGLISRWYIDQVMPANSPDGRPKVSHLIMLGTPNLGSPCADVMDIAFGMTGKQVEAVRQLQPDYLEGFNKIHTQRKGVKFSALAGNPLPVMCKSIVPNDGVVSVPSAKWKINDTAESSSLHIDLTGTSDFSAFVKPRLAIGPKGDHMPAVPETRQFTGRFGSARIYGAQWPGSQKEEPAPAAATFAKALSLVAKQTTEIAVPVEVSSNFGITFMADPNISVELLNEQGVVTGKNLARSAEARGWFRSIFYDKQTAAGTWKLKIENTGDAEYQIILTSWKDAR